MTRHFTLFFMLLFLVTSCRKKTVVVTPQPWEEIPNLSLNSTINRLHANSNEMLIATVDNFARMNLNGTITERRDLEMNRGVFGRPIVSDYVFARVIKNADSERELQFHLTKSINQIYRITDREIADSAEFIIFEELPNAFFTGAFNDDGSQFLYTTRSLNPQENRFTFFLFDINLDPTKSQFQSVTINAKISIPSSLLGTEADQITNVRYFDGFYYITSLNGLYRINPNDGSSQQIFNHWVWDIFKYKDKLYTTGFYENQFYYSEDNGENWVFANTNTLLKKVVVTGDKIFGQDQLGIPYRLSSEDFSTLREIVYNSNFFDDEPLAYQAVQFFNGKYYLSVHKRLYVVDEIVLK